MKKNRQKADTKQNGLPQFGRLSLLVGALVATGVLLPLTLPEAMAAPLPVPCGGCVNNSHVTVPFLQAGTLANLDPITGLPVANGKNLTINQTSQTAILNWQSFNIDSGYSVNFVQPNSTSSALNRIWDPTLNPTTIAGSLTANGQIYLINQNGIIFAKGAQVNANTLIASTLDISDSLYQAGYLTNVSGTADFAGTGGFVRVDTGAVLNGSRIMMFAPVVENNGSISTPDGQTVLAAGNSVYLEASQDPNLRGVLVEVDVTNPGQAVSNATDANGKSYVQNNAAGTVTNATLGNILAQRGNITLVGYAVNQQGHLSATTAVNENGTIKLEARYNVAAASQATSNGYLAQSAGVSNAYDIRATKTGTVTLASGSAITIVPETSSAATVTASQGFNPSIVEVMGKTINMQSGSKIIAPGAKVTLAAMSSIDPSATANSVYQTIVSQTIVSSSLLSSFLNPNYLPTPNPAGDTATVFLDSGSSIDVSGSTASVSVARDIIAVQLRGSELADAPLQKTGPLYGQTVYVDIRQGTTFANYSGEEAQIQRGVAELTSSGGNVQLVSTGNVVTKAGSSINISGGQVDYTGAYIANTSNLISNGVSYNIANASPNVVYSGIAGTYVVDHAKWGITQTFNTMAGGDPRGRWDPGYVQGQAAGTLTVLAPDAAVQGSVIAKTVAGSYQTQPYINPASLATNNYMNTWQMMPLGGTYVFGDANAIMDGNTKKYDYITNADIVFQADPTPLPANYAAGDALPQTQTIYLDPALWSGANGVSNVGVFTNKTVTVNSGTSLSLASGGSLTVQADTINMLGSINIASGTVNFGTVETTASVGQTNGGISVGSAGMTSTISTRGTWVNESPLLGVNGSTDPVFINGGNVTINTGNNTGDNTGGNLSVAAGTIIDASGGAMVDASNKIHGGNGGSISITGNYTQSVNPYHGQLDNLALKSFGVAGGKGGALTINAGDIVIGGTVTNGAINGALNLPVGFFSSGGFTSYSLGAVGGVNGLLVEPGAIIAPRNQSLILDNAALKVASGTDIYSFSHAGELPDWQRLPTSISLKQTGNGSGSLTIGSGSKIQVDPGASISLTSDTQLTVLGTLDAPAGNINLTLNSVAPQSGFNYGYSTIWLGGQSQLLAQGTTVMTPNANGLQQGQVLSGGNIKLTSNMFVVSQAGSLMDVSGTAANLDLPQLVSGSVVYRKSLVAGNAGSIAIKATEGALLDGSMKAGVQPNSTAAAGSFSLTLAGMQASDRTASTFPADFPRTPPWQILVESSGSGSFISNAQQPVIVAGKTDLTKVDGMAYVDVSALKNAGFDQVSLTSSNGSIVLGNQVALDARRSVTLDAPVISMEGDSASASIAASYVKLANSNLQSQTVTQPVAGTGANTLDIKAQLVDLSGNLSISGASQVDAISSGDIRLNGVLNSQPILLNGVQYAADTVLSGSLVTLGNVTLQANQVYPTTMSQFTVSVVDGSGNPAGTVTINPNNPASPASGSSPVLSAGGQVTLSASTIDQNGVLKAPMGSIILDGTQNVVLGSGSLTSVSAEGQIIPFGSILGGTGWTYNLAGTANATANSSGNITLPAPPQKQIDIQGNNVNIQKGAVVNLSGGGDLYANEFIAGTGGSVNVLNPAQGPANTYAIIPGISTFAPYDPQLTGQYAASGSKSALGVGNTVYLSGGNGLSAGYYALLPASYALLPGAYTVTMVSGHQDMLPGQGAIKIPGGMQIMAGKLGVAGTNILDARWSGFEVAPGSVARTQSQFQDSYASSFFTSQAALNATAIPLLPMDAGQLVVTANGSGATLALNGTFVAQPAAGGQGAQVDINVVGSGFDIVNGTAPANGLVQLDANALNNMGVQSLLIGGVRSQTASGTTISVGAGEVMVDNAGSVLTGPEIVLAATNAVTVKAGSSIKGTGTFAGQARNIAIGNYQVTDPNTGAVTSPAVSGDGALLRVSSGPQVAVNRVNLSGAAPTLTVESGAALGGAKNSVLLDSSYATNIGSQASLSGSSFSVSAQNIAIGNATATPVSTLLLTQSLLNQFAGFGNLTLHSYNDIDFYDSASLGGLDASQNHLIGNLTLNARSINGLINSGVNVNDVIDASFVTLTNTNGGVATPAQYGGGNLSINADSIVVAGGTGGNMAVQGFNSVTLNASGEIKGTGTGGLTVTSGDNSAHSMQVNAGQITGAAGSNLSIAASNYDISLGLNAGYTPTAGEDTLGANLTVSGKSISDYGIINMPTGSVTLNATGSGNSDGVTLAAGSQIIVSGVSKTLAGQTVYAPAGTVNLSSTNGGITLQGGSVIDVSANAGGGNAGTVNLVASKGMVNVLGTLRGKALSGQGGSFNVDAGSLAGTNNSSLTALNDTLTAGGFNYLRNIRVRTGDLSIAADTGPQARAAAQNFTLEADGGNIDVVGKVDASGNTGGNILVAAQGNVTLESGAVLDAHASGAGQAGGKVALETTAGVIDLKNQRIDVHGDGNTGGSVLLRAPQINANTDVAVNNTGGTSLNVSSGASVTVEAFRQYSATTISSTDVSTTSKYFTDAQAFANNYAAAIKNRLGMSVSDPNMHLNPGVEIDSTISPTNPTGNLTLAADWELSQWRFNNGNGTGTAFNTEVGILTLKAGGNLLLNASLSDGFAASGGLTSVAANFTPISGPSWSYRLVAGADATAANVMAVNNTGATGNVTLVAGTETKPTASNKVVTATMEQVRTGTGFIDVAAGGNVNLGNRDSVIYTAGLAATGTPSYSYNSQGSVFPVGGGDISIFANGDINGAPVNQLVSEWQWRQGQAASNGAYIAPAWWVNYAAFRQNIGALGGGNVDIYAKGNINTLSAVVPTSGYVDSSGNTVVLGGGNLNVTAGGNINSGIFYVGNGQGTIRAGGGLGSSRIDAVTGKPIYTILLLGGSFNNVQTGFNVQTVGDLNLQTVLNPTMLGYSFSQKPANGNISYFYTYDNGGNISLASLDGTVQLVNSLNTSSNVNQYGTAAFFMNTPQPVNVYPASLEVTAFDGGINNGTGPLELFPSTTGNLKLFAATNIDVGGGFGMSDMSPASLFPVNSAGGTGKAPAVSATSHGTTIDPATQLPVPVHANDTQPITIVAGGDIFSNSVSNVAILELPKQTLISAGQDITNVSADVQNQQAGDATSFVAGRDIVFNSTGTAGIYVSGPGQVILQAGRNVNLGVSDGVVTEGSLNNPALPSQGASITILAGAGQSGADAQAFIDKYIDPASQAGQANFSNLLSYLFDPSTGIGQANSAALNNFVVLNGAAQGLTATQAYAYFNTLPASLRTNFVFNSFKAQAPQIQTAYINQALFNELRASGRSAISTGDYGAGFGAIATLFSNGGYSGDLTLYNSQVKTERGGDINILAPGGGVNAGLASGGTGKSASQIGIVTVGGGNINAFVNNDFTVNQSRVFTIQGGNILMWSSNGSLDAGNGSKTATSTPPPVLVVNPKTGEFSVDATASIVGSGIRVLLGNTNVVPGSVDLFAPNGVINAGDAGIGAAGNIFLGALQVIGANNINFGGTSAGVPVAAPAPVSVGLGNLQDASKAADQATQSIASMNGVDTNDFKPTFLSIEVIGLGDQNCGDDDQSAGCKKGRPSSDSDL